ncbi:MAG: DMT family transporter [Pseudomonadota bacterium]
MAATAFDRALWTWAAPLSFVLLWSSGFAFAKLGLEDADPLTFLALRYAVVLVILVPLALVLRPPLPKSPRTWAHIAAVGFLIQVVYFSFSYLAVTKGLSASANALIAALQPILVALASPLLLREQVGAKRWLGLLLGLSGAALVILARAAVETTTPLGVTLSVLALLALAAATLYERRFGVEAHPVSANLIQYVIGFAFLLPLAALLEPMRVVWTVNLGIALAYLVIANSLISVTLLLAMLRRGEAARVSALFFLTPPMAALVAFAVLGEPLPPLAWVGMAVAGAGVALATRVTSR